VHLKHVIIRFTAEAVLIVTLSLAAVPVAGQQAEPSSAEQADWEVKTTRTTHFLRGAYQIGWILPTNSFVKGENLAGVPIDRYHSLRLEFG